MTSEMSNRELDQKIRRNKRDPQQRRHHHNLHAEPTPQAGGSAELASPLFPSARRAAPRLVPHPIIQLPLLLSPLPFGRIALLHLRRRFLPLQCAFDDLVFGTRHISVLLREFIEISGCLRLELLGRFGATQFSSEKANITFCRNY